MSEYRGSRFWKGVHLVTAVLLGIALAEAQRIFNWSGATLLIVGAVTVVIWIPLALWTIFVKDHP